MLHIEDLCVVRGQDHQAHRVYLPQLSLRRAGGGGNG